MFCTLLFPLSLFFKTQFFSLKSGYVNVPRYQKQNIEIAKPKNYKIGKIFKKNVTIKTKVYENQFLLVR